MSDVQTPSTYVGARAPEALIVTICSGASGLDLTEVSSIEFKTCRGHDWSGQIRSQTERVLVAVHIFDSNGRETNSPGTIRIFPILNLSSGGVRRAEPFNFTIKP
jgi:hypothetical protein